MRSPSRPVAGLQMLHRLHIEHTTFVGRVRTERKVIQRSGLQIEQIHYLHHRKAATGFLAGGLGILLLVASRVFELPRCGVHDHDAPPIQYPS